MKEETWILRIKKPYLPSLSMRVYYELFRNPMKESGTEEGCLHGQVLPKETIPAKIFRGNSAQYYRLLFGQDVIGRRVERIDT